MKVLSRLTAGQPGINSCTGRPSQSCFSLIAGALQSFSVASEFTIFFGEPREMHVDAVGSKVHSAVHWGSRGRS